jgi:hypothetical protein
LPLRHMVSASLLEFFKKLNCYENLNVPLVGAVSRRRPVSYIDVYVPGRQQELAPTKKLGNSLYNICEALVNMR